MPNSLTSSGLHFDNLNSTVKRIMDAGGNGLLFMSNPGTVSASGTLTQVSGTTSYTFSSIGVGSSSVKGWIPNRNTTYSITVKLPAQGRYLYHVARVSNTNDGKFSISTSYSTASVASGGSTIFSGSFGIRNCPVVWIYRFE